MKEIVPDGQGITLVAFFMVGNSFIMALGSRAGNDLWLAFLLAMAMAAPIIVVYARVRSLMHGESLAAGLENLFGTWPARIIAIAYSAYAWRLGCYVLNDVARFIRATALPTTPRGVLAGAFAILALLAVKAGVEVLARWSVVMIRGVFLILMTAFVLLMTEVDFGEFLPMMYDGVQPVLLGAFQLLDFPFLKTAVLFWIFDVFQEKNSAYKVLLPGFFIASLFLLLIATSSLAVIGTEQYVTNYFPVFVATSRIDISDFFTRLESIVATSFAVGGFLKVAVCLMAASKALTIGLGFDDYRFLVTPVALAMIPGAQWFVITMMQTEQSATKVVGASEVIFQLGIPVALWIVAEIKTAKDKKSLP